jgi:hypothetical protein
MLCSLGATLALSLHAPSDSLWSNILQQAEAAEEGLSCEALSYENVLEQQNRINRYFHGTVVPEMMRCWQGLSREGTVTVQFEYHRAGDQWVPGNSTLGSSTLPEDQSERALHCLQEAVLDTSFDVTEADGDTRELVIHWDFPVPWPQDIVEAVQLASSHNPGGAHNCYEGCPKPVGAPTFCKRAPFGFRDCTLDADGHGCRLSGHCVSGAVFFNVGGFVLYSPLATSAP